MDMGILTLLLLLFCTIAVATNYFAILDVNASGLANLTQEGPVEVVPDCAKLCEREECLSFTFNFETGICNLYSSRFTGSFDTPTTEYSYFQKATSDENCAPISIFGTWARCNIYNSFKWIVVQRRFDGSQSFQQSWEQYKHGFGEEYGEYWIGNEALHLLTSAGPYSAMFVIEDWDGVEKYAQYDTFSVASEADNYRLNATGYNGTAGDSLAFHNGMAFTTFDRDNDRNLAGSCSTEYGNSGWWFNICHTANINGNYLTYDGTETPYGLSWLYFYGTSNARFQPMKKSRMMIRRINT